MPGATLSSSLCVASRILSFSHLLSVENKPLSPEQAGRGARWWVRTRGVTWFCADGVGGGSGGNCLLTSLSRLGSSLRTHSDPADSNPVLLCSTDSHCSYVGMPLCACAKTRARAGLCGPRSLSAQGPYMCQDFRLLSPPLKYSLSLRVMSFKFCHCDFSRVLGGKGNEYLPSICHD